MEILQDEMLLGAWPSNLLTLVCTTLQTFSAAVNLFPFIEVLTPVDQPLDKLDDLKPDEVYVYPLSNNDMHLKHNYFQR